MPWRQGRISEILRDPVYIGTIKNAEGEFPNMHEPVIPIELWEAVGRCPLPGDADRVAPRTCFCSPGCSTAPAAA